MALLMIYGANGYTGRLMAMAARAQGLPVMLAGRNAAALERLGRELDMPCRVFDASDRQAAVAALADVRVLLNAAGPFTRTALPLVQACCASGTHYLDITGEVEVFSALADLHQQLLAANIMAMPGAGFDVVPSDCLAAHLKRRLPEAESLDICVNVDMKMSHGTAVTTVENMGRPALLRQDGRLLPVPMGRVTRRVGIQGENFVAVAMPLGELVTAWHSTGIAAIRVFVTLPWGERLGLRASAWLAPLLRQPLLQSVVKQVLRWRMPGPSATHRASGSARVWGEAVAGSRRVRSLLITPDHYDMTVCFALGAAERMASGQWRPGFQTPSSAFGPDFVLDFAGVTREDL